MVLNKAGFISRDDTFNRNEHLPFELLFSFTS